MAATMHTIQVQLEVLYKLLLAQSTSNKICSYTGNLLNASQMNYSYCESWNWKSDFISLHSWDEYQVCYISQGLTLIKLGIS